MHNNVAISLNLHFYPFRNTIRNPRLSPSAPRNNRQYSVLRCKGLEIPIPKQCPNSLSIGNGSGDEMSKTGIGVKEIDVVTLGNLCVDIVLNVSELPPKNTRDRQAYMEELSKSPPDKGFWEAGGNCNMAIAAARLGLHVVTVGHVGNEIYGHFLLDVLHAEGINTVEITGQSDVMDSLRKADETLLCWVLVDHLKRHGFCSRADFSKEPAFSWMIQLSTEAKNAIRRSKVIFCNGYGFDELSPHLLMLTLDYAIEVGTVVFFDPGPRGKALITGTCDEQKALDMYLRMSDVLLLTSEEAESLTGIEDPVIAGQELLRKGSRTKWVIIKMGRKGSILITSSSMSCAPAFKVNVIDTVGCGDSFVAAIAFGFIQKLPLIYTLIIANAVGGATSMGCGAGRNVATLWQVMELITGCNLNEEYEFWEELLKKHLDCKEITLVTKAAGINERNNLLKFSSVQKAVCEILPGLESVHAKQVRACL